MWQPLTATKQQCIAIAHKCEAQDIAYKLPTHLVLSVTAVLSKQLQRRHRGHAMHHSATQEHSVAV